MESVSSQKPSNEILFGSRSIWNVVVVTADPTTRSELQQIFSRLGIDASWLLTAEECGAISRRDMVAIVFSDERMPDGDYWDVYRAITRGLITKPKIVLIPRSMTRAECEQAKRCGIFAVLERPYRPAMIEWTVILANRKRSAVGSFSWPR